MATPTSPTATSRPLAVESQPRSSAAGGARRHHKRRKWWSPFWLWRHRSGRRRRRRFDIQARRRRRRLIRRGWALGGVALLVGVLAAVALHQGLRARTQLVGARA